MADRKEREGDERKQSGGFLGNLIDLVEKLTELAEKGEELSRSGNIQFPGGGTKKDLKGVYGFSVRTGIGGKGMRVEPFGNIGRDEKTGESVVQEIHEPMVDVFEEEDHVLVVAEMPGIEAEEISVDIKGDVMTIFGTGEERRYRKEVLLPGEYNPDGVKVSYRNGIAQIRCTR